MSATTVAIGLVQNLLAPFRSNQPATGPSGATAVIEAVHEMGNVTDGVFEATLGEPDIEPNEGLFTSDPKVVIPVENAKYGDPGSLVFDIPQGAYDENAKLWSLLDKFDLALSDIGDLEGSDVPVRYSGGNVVVMWDQLDGSDPEDGPAADE